MSQYQFHDEYTLAETADGLGQKAMELGLIPSFVVRHPDSNNNIPNENESEPLTP